MSQINAEALPTVLVIRFQQPLMTLAVKMGQSPQQVGAKGASARGWALAIVRVFW